MNGIHDMGGMDGFGPLIREENEPVFHHEWERKVIAHALALFAAGYFRDGEFRHSQERIPAAEYLSASYYERWLRGLETLLVEHDIVTPEELAAGRSLRAQGDKGKALPPAAPERVRYGLKNRISASLEVDIAPRFAPGEQVRARNINPPHHTRLPRYVRGKRGEIERNHGVFPFPDSDIRGETDRPQHVYSVRFDARELWGDDAPPNDAVHIDLFDDYLEPLAPARPAD